MTARGGARTSVCALKERSAAERKSRGRTLSPAPDPAPDKHGLVQPPELALGVRLHLDAEAEPVLVRAGHDDVVAVLVLAAARGVRQALEDVERARAPAARLDLDKGARRVLEEVARRELRGERGGRVRRREEVLRVLAAGSAFPTSVESARVSSVAL